jgi:5-enolpyruvylshikimate-3-phosphate synthase
MAMAAAVAAAAVGDTERASPISGFDSVATSYPRFAEHLQRLAGAR